MVFVSVNSVIVGLKYLPFGVKKRENPQCTSSKYVRTYVRPSGTLSGK